MSTPHSSIIIPSLNSPRIGEVVHALRNQEWVDTQYEIIVIGKDDHDLLKTQLLEDERLKFLKFKKNLNPAEARNIGIKEAKGRLLFFVDSDCVARSDWMAKILDRYESGQPVIGGAMEFDGRDGFWTLCDNIAHFNNHHYSNKRQVFDSVPLLAANLFMEKKIAIDAGRFDERFVRGQDFDFCMRIRRLGYSLFFEPAAIVRHRPVRNTFRTMIKHTSEWAPFSIRIRDQYVDLLSTPWYLTKPWLLLTLSPLIAGAVMTRAYWQHPPLLKYWYMAGLIYIDRLAWCYYVSKELFNGGLGSLFESDGKK